MFPRKDKDNIPNKFTLEMGRLIKNAREEKGLSQKKLAEKAYRRRETISLIENGKSEVGTLTLTYIASALEKPLIYFFPDFSTRKLQEDSLSAEEQELLAHFRRIVEDPNVVTALNQIKSLADLYEKQSVEKYNQDVIDNMDKESKTYKRLKKKGYIQD